ncbi:hypothetical protein ACLOJK_037778 [Asimina triloba]
MFVRNSGVRVMCGIANAGGALRCADICPSNHDAPRERDRGGEGQRPCSSASFRAAFLLHLFRAASVLALAVIASFVPGFGALVSLVGSTFCALLSFVLPAIFHLALATPSFPQRILDRCISLFGVAFACYGTYTAVLATP